MIPNTWLFTKVCLWPWGPMVKHKAFVQIIPVIVFYISCVSITAVLGGPGPECEKGGGWGGVWGVGGMYGGEVIVFLREFCSQCTNPPQLLQSLSNEVNRAQFNFPKQKLPNSHKGTWAQVIFIPKGIDAINTQTGFSRWELITL